MTTPLLLRPKLWTTFQRLELSGNGVPCTPRSRSRNARNNSIFQVIHRHLGNGSPPGTRTTRCPGTRKSSLNNGMAYRHSIGEIKPERDGPERDGPEGDGPERDDPVRGDQLSMSGRNQLVMSPDERGYRSPHNLAIPQKDGPERDDQLVMSGRNQLVMSPDEQGYRSPHNLAIPRKIIGKNYYISSKPHETQFSLSLGDPEKDGPERNGQDDQLTMSGRNQLSMSPDEQGYIRPHNLAISNKINGNPESTNQNPMNPDEQAHISPYNLAVQKKIGET